MEQKKTFKVRNNGQFFRIREGSINMFRGGLCQSRIVQSYILTPGKPLGSLLMTQAHYNDLFFKIGQY